MKPRGRIFMYALFFIIPVAVAGALAGCETLKEAPQTDTAYQPAQYQGQVPGPVQKELEEKYPSGFYQKTAAANPAEDRLKVGIRQFLNITVKSDNAPNLGEMTTEIFTTSFAGSEAFDVIERHQMEKVFAEFKLRQHAALDDELVQKIGNLAGIDLLVTGSVSQMGDHLRVDARAIEIGTGKVVVAVSIKTAAITKSSTLYSQKINLLAQKMINQLASEMYGKQP